MKVGILGSGRMGGTLGAIWSRAGHQVTFSYARRKAKLEQLARECAARSGTPAEAVTDADAVLIAVHWMRLEDVLAQAGDLDDKVVITCCVPLDESDENLVVGTTDSGAERLARRLPNARIVAAFNTSPSEALPAVFAAKGTEPAPHLLYYGNDARAKEIARTLIVDAGYAPLDAGPLHSARFVEPFAMVTAELAYAQPGGPKLTYRFERLD